jgi:hypothetical protein
VHLITTGSVLGSVHVPACIRFDIDTPTSTVLEGPRSIFRAWPRIQPKSGPVLRFLIGDCAGRFLVSRHGNRCNVRFYNLPRIIRSSISYYSAAVVTESPRRNVAMAIRKSFYRILIFYVRHVGSSSRSWLTGCVDCRCFDCWNDCPEQQPRSPGAYVAQS